MDIARRRARMSRLWAKKAPYEAVFQECYDHFMPNRQSGKKGKSIKTTDHIFDMTGPNSARHFPGELKRIVLPDNQPFVIETGPLIANQLAPAERDAWNTKLSMLSSAVYPYFQSGGFDHAVSACFTDLAVTTGYVMPVRGPSMEEPLFFVCLPTDQVAVEWDGFNRLSVLNWKKSVSREAVMDQWPDGKYTDEFKKLLKEKPDDLVTLIQDFERKKAGGWTLSCYLERDGGIIETRDFRTQPVAAVRFYVTPNEDYSLGPVVFALPTVRTQNQAQKLALKAFAMQMLGLWAYRSGGTFNPNTVRLAPGEFIPMQSTGGVMGPDIQRLDASTGRIDLARMLLSTGQQQIRDTLLDTRMVDDGGTPASASEIAAKVRQNANVHLGAYGQVIQDLLPVVVPHAMEILNDWRLLPNLMNFNQLLLSMKVVSPMARAVKVADFEAAAQYASFVQQLTADEPGTSGRYIKKDALANLALETLLVDRRVVPNEEERKAFDESFAASQQQAMVSAMAQKAAPQIAGALLQPEGIAA